MISILYYCFGDQVFSVDTIDSRLSDTDRFVIPNLKLQTFDMKPTLLR